MTFSDDAVIFFQNIIGQLVIVLLAIISGVKFLEKRQESQIDVKVREIMNPIANDLKDELNNVKHCLERFQEVSKVTIESLKDSLDRLEHNNRFGSKRYDHGR